MVTRKPVPGRDGLPQPSGSPPYPVTPVTSQPPRNRRHNLPVALQPAIQAESSSSKLWDVEGMNSAESSEPTRFQGQNKPTPPIPDALKIGPPRGVTPKSSREHVKPLSVPLKDVSQQQHTGGGLLGDRGSSEPVWTGLHRSGPPITAPPPPPSSLQTRTSTSRLLPTRNNNLLTIKVDFPVEIFSKVKISEPSNNPWQPALDASRPSTSHSRNHTTEEQASGQETTFSPSSRLASEVTHDPSNEADLIDFDENASAAWDEDDYSEAENDEEGKLTPPNGTPPGSQQDSEAHQVWTEDLSHKPQDQAHPVLPQASDERARRLQQEQTRTDNHGASQLAPTKPEGWNMIDHEKITSEAQHDGTIDSHGRVSDGQSSNHEDAPPLPPRASDEQPFSQPTRSTQQPGQSSLFTKAAAQKQRAETYEIKKISWYDANAIQNPRVSPILVQNANGPCPLLALVNALTLSTPPDIGTALVETLRTRERVSLGLLLDAVFDELMSGRRGDAAQELPDVSDLYDFLLTLHTGMNVNPRFLSPTEASQSGSARLEQEEAMPGTFEETREMSLYSTFSIPLIHGWLAKRDTPAYLALSRSARTYEDAQNLMFHEESLEEKLQNEGLSLDEQTTLEDITTIKGFLISAATQLTSYGLKVIATCIPPGTIAILFRNDHFSTLYRHPRTLQLMQLVTDLGYAGHEDVVWESLIDVSGERADFFSGDFRVVGGASSTPSNNRSAGHSRRSNSNHSTSHGGRRSTSPQLSPSTEQEDHDLALALQLQEEEEERHRSEQAARRREAELSQQYIEQQGGSGRGSIPVSQRTSSRPNRTSTADRAQHRTPRRGSSSHDIRPVVPPRRNGTTSATTDPEAGESAPPPSYEHAATQDPYVPPVNHPAHPTSSVDEAARRTGAYTANSTTPSHTPTFSSIQTSPNVGSGRGRRQALVGQIRDRQGIGLHGQHRDRDKECTVM